MALVMTIMPTAGCLDRVMTSASSFSDNTGDEPPTTLKDLFQVAKSNKLYKYEGKWQIQTISR